MRSFRRYAALVVGVAAALPTAAAVAAAPPARGWIVDAGVRFEPLDGRPLTVDGVGDYRGAIEVRPGGHVIDDVALEDYVKGIAEVPATWPAEALKAQAIAARTYALYQMARKDTGPVTEWRAAGAHICATQDCQVYAGVAKERKAPAWVAAAEATKGQVVLFNGGPILAMYSSSNGGASLPGSQPYLRPVRDPDDSAASPVSHWRYALPLDVVGAAFAMPGRTFDVGRAGDAVVLTSQLDDGTQQQQSQPLAAFRDRLNAVVPPPGGLPKTVPSLRFTVSTNGDGVVVDGRGFGHGIGMSQFGALGKALRGMPASDILATYYGGLRPVQLQPQQLPATIRVEVAAGRADTAVTGGRFRVLDGRGNRLAVSAGGTWHVVPAPKGRVRVVPPAGADQPLGIDLLGYDAARDSLGVRVNLPVDVQATVDGVAQPSHVLDPGERTVTVPDLAPGNHHVVLAADAGAGRVAAIERDVVVPDPSATTTTSRTDQPAETPRTVVEAMVAPVRTAATTTFPWPVAAIAFALAALAGTGGGALYRSRRSRSS